MKNKSVGKKIGTFISIVAALVVAVIFWLVVKYMDSGVMEAVVSFGSFGGVL